MAGQEDEETLSSSSILIIQSSPKTKAQIPSTSTTPLSSRSPQPKEPAFLQRQYSQPLVVTSQETPCNGTSGIRAGMLRCILQRQAPVTKLLNTYFKHQNRWHNFAEVQSNDSHGGNKVDPSTCGNRAQLQRSCHPEAGLGWLIPLFCSVRSPQAELKGSATAGQQRSSQSYTMDDTGLLCKKTCCVKKRRKERRNLINTSLFLEYIMQNLAWNLYLS